MRVDDVTTGYAAVSQPMPDGAAVPDLGFVDARLTRIARIGDGDYWDVGGFISWGAVYESVEHAASAFDILVAAHMADTGWGMAPVYSAQLGAESRALFGEAYGLDARLHIWRIGNLVLAIGALGETANENDVAERLVAIAGEVDGRTR